MFISVGMIFVGAVLIVAGWSNVSVASALRGDNTQPKPAITGGPSSSTGTGSASSSSSSAGPSGSSGYSQGSGANLH